jgi:CBS domain-containing protein
MGFTRVFDYPPGRIGWAARGLPTEGQIGDRSRVGALARRDVPRCRVDETIGAVAARVDGGPDDDSWCVVLSSDDVVVGLLRPEALVLEPDRPVATAMIPAPGTVRPHLRIPELARQLDHDHLGRILVTTAEGVFVGLVHREDLRAS